MNQSPFVRLGNKLKIVKTLEMYMPEDFTIFVEPFVGSGNVFLNISLEEKRVVINDLDKQLIDAYKYVKKVNKKNFLYMDKNLYKDVDEYLDVLNEINDSLLSKKLTLKESFIKEMLNALTFGGKGKGKLYSKKINLMNRFDKRIPTLKGTLEDVIIENKDYIEIIKKYDSKKVFFFLDPPYQNSKLLYKHGEFDLVEFSKIVKQIKGKVMITLNDSMKVRELFKDYRIVKVKVQGQKGGDTGLGGGYRDELIILNY
ncbi:MAG: Geobacillus virus [Pseudomonadota bacterium]|jgi:DNA adenine methylase